MAKYRASFEVEFDALDDQDALAKAQEISVSNAGQGISAEARLVRVVDEAQASQG